MEICKRMLQWKRVEKKALILSGFIILGLVLLIMVLDKDLDHIAFQYLVILGIGLVIIAIGALVRYCPRYIHYVQIAIFLLIWRKCILDLCRSA